MRSHVCRLLRLMWMAWPRIDLEFGGHLPPEFILGQHAGDRVFDDPLWTALPQRFITLLLLPAGVVHIRVQFLLLPLLAGEDDLLGVGDDHEVSSVHVRRVLGTMLAHEN